jgi:hypothetical protein
MYLARVELQARQHLLPWRCAQLGEQSLILHSIIMFNAIWFCTQMSVMRTARSRRVTVKCFQQQTAPAVAGAIPEHLKLTKQQQYCFLGCCALATSNSTCSRSSLWMCEFPTQVV